MPVLDEPHSGEVSKGNLGRTSKSHPEVEMQEAISRTAHEDFSTAMARQPTFRITDGSVVGKNRTKKHVFGTKETLEQFFSGSSGFPGSSAYNEVDQHVQASSVSLSIDRRPRQSPSDVPTSSEMLVKVINSLPSLQWAEVTEPCSTNSNVNELPGTCEVSYEMQIINIPISSTLPPGVVPEEGQSHVPCTIDAEGSTDMFKCSTMMSDFNVPIITSSARSSTTHVAMTSYHITPFDADTRPSASSRLPGSLNVAEDARLAAHHSHDVLGSSRHYAHHLGQTTRASYTNHGSSLELHPTPEFSWNSPVDGADLNSEFLTDVSRDQLDDRTQLVNRIIPNNSDHTDHSYSSNGPQYRLIKITEHNISLFYCCNTLTGDRIGPVDVSEVETSAFESFVTSCFEPIYGEARTSYSSNTGRLYQSMGDGGLDVISPVTSTASPLSDNYSEFSQSPSFSQFPTRFPY